MYHDVCHENASESGLASDLYKVNVSDFREQIKIIAEYIKKDNSIILTFDDGGSSFYNPIVDILDEFGLKGIFFVATNFINKTGFLSDLQLRMLEERGHIIGSHSHSHPENISSLSEEEIMNEWLISLKKLNDILGHKVSIASIPNGYESKLVLKYAEQVGIKDLYTSKPTTQLFRYKKMRIHGRYVVLSNTGVDGIMGICNSKAYRMKQYWKWVILSILKLILGDKYENAKQFFFK